MGFEIVIYVAVAAAMMVFVFRPLFVERGEVERASNRETKRRDLLEKREQVLLIPERVVTFEGDSATVTVLLADNQIEERLIQTGLSDAINVEVLDGLDEGEKVREKPPKVIE